jgi:hypothetical protein
MDCAAIRPLHDPITHFWSLISIALCKYPVALSFLVRRLLMRSSRNQSENAKSPLGFLHPLWWRPDGISSLRMQETERASIHFHLVAKLDRNKYCAMSLLKSRTFAIYQLQIFHRLPYLGKFLGGIVEALKPIGVEWFPATDVGE